MKEKYELNIAKRLKNLRNMLGLTQKEMAADVISVSQYSKIERGVSKVDIETLSEILWKNNQKISDFLNRTIVNKNYSNFQTEIAYAKNNKDVEALNKLAIKIKDPNLKIDESKISYLRINLEVAYLWVTGSTLAKGKELERIKKAAKSILYMGGGTLMDIII